MRLILLVVLSIGCTAPPPAKAPTEAPREYAGQSSVYTGTSEHAGDLLVPLVVLFHPETKVEVQVLGMVHLADARFYAEASRICAEADLVLSEGVRGSASLSPLLFTSTYLFATTRRMTHVTGLAAQGDAFDPGSNAISGDVDLAEWSAWMPWYTPLTQAVLTPLLAAIIEVAAVEVFVYDALAKASCCGDEWQLRARHFVAGVLDEKNDDDDAGDELLVPGVLDHRNERLLEKLDAALDERPSVRRVVLPWGAAHVKGLVEGLETRGYQRTDLRWLECWTIRSASRESLAARPTSFWIPWLVAYRAEPNTQGAQEAFDLALVADSVALSQRATGAWRFELCWELLFTLSGGSREGSALLRVGPLLFGRPLLFERRERDDDATWRFLLFAEI
jgi:hypothetical protein